MVLIALNFSNFINFILAQFDAINTIVNLRAVIFVNFILAQFDIKYLT